MLCFTLYLRAISKYKPPGAYIWRGDLTEGFLRYELGGLIFGEAYTWRAYFRNFTVFRFPDLAPLLSENIEGKGSCFRIAFIIIIAYLAGGVVGVRKEREFGRANSPSGRSCLKGLQAVNLAAF